MNRKRIRTRGKLQLSRYFQDLKKGESVSVVSEASIPSTFPKRIQGRTGIIEGRRGKSLMVKIKDQNKVKRFLMEAIHLKKITQ
jgi:ribosomal protein L21E